MSGRVQILERDVSASEIMKALDICDKLGFFGGTRAGRELWVTKPMDVQNTDIMTFNEDISFIKDIINRMSEEVDRTSNKLCFKVVMGDEKMEQIKNECLERVEYNINEIKARAIEEFAEKVKKYAFQSTDWSHGIHPMVVEVDDIDELVADATDTNVGNK